MEEALGRLRASEDGLVTIAYLDDVYLVVAPENLDRIMQLVQNLWGELGLKINAGKVKV